MADLYSAKEQPAQGEGSPDFHKRHTSAEGGQAPISRCQRCAAGDNRGVGWFENRSESDLRRSRVRTLYDFEVECRKQGWGDPAFVYDEEHDLFRWTDGRFAFSREHADWTLLRKRGRLKGF